MDIHYSRIKGAAVILVWTQKSYLGGKVITTTFQYMKIQKEKIKLKIIRVVIKHIFFQTHHF